MLAKYFLILFALIFPLLTAATEQNVIIGFHKSIGFLERKLVTSNGGTIQRELHLINALVAKVPDTALPLLHADAGVKYIEQDRQLHTPHPLPRPAVETTAASVAEYQQNWSIQHIASDTAHSQGITGTGVKIAIIDTGIDYNHVELKDNYRGGYDFVNDDDDPMDDSGPSHGTLAAGIIAAKQNDEGIVGVAPDASLYALKVMDSEGSSSISNIIAALQWAVENDIDIASISMGGPDSPAFRQACNAAYDAGVLIVAAAGNAVPRKPVDYPAAYGSVIAVGATDKQDQPEPYTARGDEVELAAPGAVIYSTVRNGRYGTASGTSQAAPHVTGVAALILSAGVKDLNKDGLTDNKDVRLALLMATRDQGEPGRDDLYGYGIIDINGIFTPRPIQLPDLSLTMRDDRDPVFRGNWFNYLLTVQNDSAVDARDTKLLLTLPPDMVAKGDHCTPVAAKTDSGNGSHNTPLVCQLGLVAKNGGARTLDITVKMARPGTTGSVVAKALVVTPLETNSADNSAEETTDIANRPPSTRSISITAVMNTSKTTYNVLNSARDPDRDPLFIDSADSRSQAGGTVVNHNDGTFTYTPPVNFTGNDSFDYVISDGHGGSATGTVDIEVRIKLTATIEYTPDPAAPGDDIVYTITLGNGSAIDVNNIELTLILNDAQLGFLSADKNCRKTPGGFMICTIDQIGKNGGIARFQVTARALAATTTYLLVFSTGTNDLIEDIGLHKKTVIKTVNSAPVANDDQVTTEENKPLTINTALNNDTDSDGDRLRIADADETSREGGHVALTDDTTITYTPPADFSGEDSFQYTLGDGNGGSAIGTITITVTKKIVPDPVSPAEPQPEPKPESSSPQAGASGPLILLMLLAYLLGRATAATSQKASVIRDGF